MEPDIQKIVREVVAEIERRHRADSNDAGAAPPEPGHVVASDAPAAGAKPDDPRELTVCSRVVGLAEIGDRLGHIRRLVVAPGAILTPAVRDALDDRGIAVTYDASRRAVAAASDNVFLAAVRTSLDPSGLAAALTTAGIAVESQTSECLIRTVDAIGSRVRDGNAFNLILTHDTAAALCLANRLPNVRAVSASCPTGTIEAARSVGANVLVVDPRGKGVFQLKQIIAAFCREKPWPCPETLETRLE